MIVWIVVGVCLAFAGLVAAVMPDPPVEPDNNGWDWR